MAIILTEFGLVPPGVHDYPLAEIDETFGRFQRSDVRLKLMERLRGFVEAVWKVSDEIRIIVDGSFVMGTVDEPGDIDVILVMPKNWDFSAELAPFQYNILSKRMVRKLLRFDMIVTVANQQSETDAVNFFSQVNVKWNDRIGIPPATRKGLIRIIQ